MGIYFLNFFLIWKVYPLHPTPILKKKIYRKSQTKQYLFLMLISQFSKKIQHLILSARLDSQLSLFCNSFFCCKWLYLLQHIFLLQFFFEFLKVDESECTLHLTFWNNLKLSHNCFLESLRWHFCFTSSLYRVALYFIHQMLCHLYSSLLYKVQLLL